MKLTRQIHDPSGNPFCNRFHVPVHSRPDEMQAYTHMVWLNEPAALAQSTENQQQSRPWGTALAVAFALLLVVVFSARYLSN